MIVQEQKKSPKYITKKTFHSIIEPSVNNIIYAEVFSNKNYLDLILKNANVPQVLVRKIDGTLLNLNYELISNEEAKKILLEEKEEMIYKPTIESCGGRGIIFLDNKIAENRINDILQQDNFIIQRIVKQHEKLKEFNSSSLNTVRVMTLLLNNNVHILYMVLRVGKEGMKLDNASAGGIQIPIMKNGMFSNNIVTIDNKKVTDEKILKKYNNKEMPFYNQIAKEVKRLHPFISTCKIVGWDIAIDEKGNPTVIEINLEDIGMTDKSQAVNGPLFGEITDNLLNILTQKRRLK